MLPAFVILRVIAARIYGSGLLAAVKSARIRMLDLADNERDALGRLDLLHVKPPPARHFLLRLVAWAGTRTGGFIGGFMLFWIWFAFIAVNYIAEFFNYHPTLGWLNQPLVQLPWFRYIPPSIQNPVAEIGLSLLAIGLILIVRAVAIKLKQSLRYWIEDRRSKHNPSYGGHTW